MSIEGCALRVDCPHCGAWCGQLCRNYITKELVDYIHRSRIDSYNEKKVFVNRDDLSENYEI